MDESYARARLERRLLRRRKEEGRDFADAHARAEARHFGRDRLRVSTSTRCASVSRGRAALPRTRQHGTLLIITHSTRILEALHGRCGRTSWKTASIVKNGGAELVEAGSTANGFAARRASRAEQGRAYERKSRGKKARSRTSTAAYTTFGMTRTTPYRMRGGTDARHHSITLSQRKGRPRVDAAVPPAGASNLQRNARCPTGARRWKGWTSTISPPMCAPTTQHAERLEERSAGHQGHLRAPRHPQGGAQIARGRRRAVRLRACVSQRSRGSRGARASSTPTWKAR